jgi:hypothetical protein
MPSPQRVSEPIEKLAARWGPFPRDEGFTYKDLPCAKVLIAGTLRTPIGTALMVVPGRLSSTPSEVAKSRRQKICLSMIVKDEAPVIARCLASVRPIIDYWIIVDTGSTDGTPAIVRKVLGDLPGELYERPWLDFVHNRSEALFLVIPAAGHDCAVQSG